MHQVILNTLEFCYTVLHIIGMETYISPMNSTLLGSVTPALFIANSPNSLLGFDNTIGLRFESSDTMLVKIEQPKSKQKVHKYES